MRLGGQGGREYSRTKAPCQDGSRVSLLDELVPMPNIHAQQRSARVAVRTHQCEGSCLAQGKGQGRPSLVAQQHD